MTDLAFSFTGLEADLSLLMDDINTDEGLETAVSLSLFTDRRAANDDLIPDGSTDKRGSWLDSYPEVDNDLIGSRLWLLFREKSQTAVINRANEYLNEALQWMLDDGVAQAINAQAEFVGNDVLQLTIAITRPPFGSSQDTDVNYQYEINWREQALKRE